MHRYNICHRLITGELLYLSKHQQWVSDVTQAVTLHTQGAQAQRIDESADPGDVLGVFMMRLHQTSVQTTTVFSVVPKQSQPPCGHDHSVARRA
jgi:hypothetical protein